MSRRRGRVLTTAGRRVVWASIGAIVVGRFLGILELYLLAAAGLGLVAVAAVRIRFARPQLDVHRSVAPARVHAGTPSRVVLTVRNPARRTSRVVALDDPVSGTGSASLLIDPLPAGDEVVSSYRLPTERRGVITVGPMTLTVADPFGLASRVVDGAPATDLTVLPAIEALRGRALSSGDDPLAGSDRATALGRLGEDFSGLRQYVVGDDIRRVHWAATARHDDLLVRQDEQPWQGRTTILLDVRRSATDEATFERQVSAAASIAVAVHRRGDLVRLVTSDGSDTGFGAGNVDLERILEHLAIVQPSGSGRWPRAMRALDEGGGAVVAVLAGPAQADLDALVALRRRLASLLVVHLPLPGGYAAGGGPAAGVPPGHGSADGVRSSGTRRGVRVIVVGPGEPLAAAWDQALGSGPRSAGEVLLGANRHRSGSMAAGEAWA
ncbi:MAG: DUF58 domain-containing protein [Actinobacteria bacterium]|nr:DUF58 domain-containing protein [Actinomycetota bacterium]